MLRFALIAGMAGLLSTAAIAQPSAQAPSSMPEPASTPPPPSSTGAADNDPDKIVCKNVKPPTGTRLASSRSRQRVCMSKSQWEDQEREAQEALKVRDRGTCSNGACSG